MAVVDWRWGRLMAVAFRRRLVAIEVGRWKGRG